MRGDTSTVQTIQAPNFLIPGTMTEAVINATGAASVTISTARKTVHANFTPNQIFVSLDHGTIPGPFQEGRGYRQGACYVPGTVNIGWLEGCGSRRYSSS